MKRNWIILILCLFFIACETERERYRRLSDELDKLEQELKGVSSQAKKYEEERQKTWNSTAKERYAHLYEIGTYNDKPLKHCDYIRQITLTKKKQKLYELSVKIYSPVEIKPKYYIYLHDKQGLLVGTYYYPDGKIFKFSKKVPANQTIERPGGIKNVDGEPYFFRVEIVQ